MARNKYPEQTATRILDTAQRLFIEKGYEKTTIQDIVDALDGLSKGAIYHHFKGKDEIIDALGTRMFQAHDPFDAVAARGDLSGLEKIREVLRAQYRDPALVDVNLAAMPLLKNPRYLAQQLYDLRDVLAPKLASLIEQGMADGSIAPGNARYLAETFLLLCNIWLVPSVFPAAPGTGREKIAFLRRQLDGMGLPVLDGSMEDILIRMLDGPAGAT